MSPPSGRRLAAHFLVEVVAAIRRRTGSEDLACEVKKEILEIDNLSFVVLDQKAATEASDLAIQTAVRGKVTVPNYFYPL